MVLVDVPFDMSRIVVYVRTSTEEQNPENQLKDCLSIVPLDIKGMVLPYFLIEDKNSAWKEDNKRVGFNTVISLVKRKRLKTLIVWDLDRVYRNRRRLLDFFSLCKLYNVKVLSFRQGWLNDISDMPSPFDEIVFDLMLQIMGWIAEEESNRKSDRVKNAIRLKDDGAYSYKGNKWGRKKVSTFKVNKIKALLLINPNITIREIGRVVNLSVGAVHKLVCKIKRENQV